MKNKNEILENEEEQNVKNSTDEGELTDAAMDTDVEQEEAPEEELLSAGEKLQIWFAESQ